MTSDATPSSGIAVAPGVRLAESDLRWTYARSSGPGGQNVNKLATKVQLHVPLAALRRHIGAAATERLALLAGPARLTDQGELLITTDQTRSQRMNRSLCLERLRTLLLEALRPPRRRHRTRPTAGSRQRRLDEKKKHGAAKQRRAAPRDE